MTSVDPTPTSTSDAPKASGIRRRPRAAIERPAQATPTPDHDASGEPHAGPDAGSGVQAPDTATAEPPHSVEPHGVEARDHDAAPADDVRRCPNCGSNDLWDNRNAKAMGRRSPKFPDFKCRACRQPIWVSEPTSSPAAPNGDGSAHADGTSAGVGAARGGTHRTTPQSARDRTAEATRFVLEHIKPVYTAHGIPMSEWGVTENVRIIAALSTSRAEHR